MRIKLDPHNLAILFEQPELETPGIFLFIAYPEGKVPGNSVPVIRMNEPQKRHFHDLLEIIPGQQG